MATKKKKVKKVKKTSIEDRIKPVGDIEKNMAMLVHGRSGSGKTEFASTWETPIIFLDINEGGLDTVGDKDDIDVLEIATWEDFEDAYWYLAGGTHYNTIVVDQITNLQDLAINEVLRKKGKTDEDLITIGMWGDIGGLLRKYIRQYKQLISEYNICWLAHERTFGGEGDDDDDDDEQIAPNIGARVIPSVGAALDGAMDAIGSTFIREEWIDVKVEGKKKKKKTEEKRIVQYCMRLGPHAFYTTKLRRPKDAGPIPEYIVNATYQKIRDLNKGKSIKKKSKKLKRNK